MNVLFTTYTTLQSYKFDSLSSVEEYFILKKKETFEAASALTSGTSGNLARPFREVGPSENSLLL